MSIHFWCGIFIVFLTYLLLINNRYRWFYIIYKTIGRDLRALNRFVLYNANLWYYEKTNQTVPKTFSKIVQKHPDKIAFYFEDKVWTFKEIEIYSNKVGNYFKSRGFKKGDTVALLLESRPEYVCIWLGLAKIGCVTALINTNLVQEPLLHSVSAADATCIIFGSDFRKAIEDVKEKLFKYKLYQWSDQFNHVDVLPTVVNLCKELEEVSSSPLKEIEQSNSKDKLLYIYTSGTTGLPKAAVVTHLRFYFMSFGMNIMAKVHKRDIVYDPLPLYHSAGGVLGVGQCILIGITVVLRRKFSASSFWHDCIKHKCTVAQYIGEICRYILAAHNKDNKPIKHSVRTMVGNGLKPQIWKKFISKFNISNVVEFYGATEGNSNMINLDNRIGAVGFVPRYASFVYPITLIKCDENTGEIIRDSNGFCTRCKPGEPGVLIGCVNVKKTIQSFSGYANKIDTEKKIMRNVLKKGDCYFNSGDILVQDEFGYYYFKDRTGDTFRWKGENVATAEIEAVISDVINLSDAVVYGVEIPNTEGRAGMVAIVDNEKRLNTRDLCKGLKDNLPSYAIPIFLRVVDSISLTGTFKLKKTDLQKEGYNINEINDKVYIYDAKEVDYIELTETVYNNVITGKLRL